MPAHVAPSASAQSRSRPLDDDELLLDDDDDELLDDAALDGDEVLLVVELELADDPVEPEDVVPDELVVTTAEELVPAVPDELEATPLEDELTAEAPEDDEDDALLADALDALPLTAELAAPDDDDVDAPEVSPGWHTPLAQVPPPQSAWDAQRASHTRSTQV
ncbi:MAG: hypothetical protein AB2A00_22975 [Myxococcota bacterium]